MYRILVIGSGGREYIIGKRLKEENNTLFFLPGNGGTLFIGENIDAEQSDFNKIYKTVQEKRIDLIVVGPEKPLADGIVDFMKERGVKIFGPPQSGARLESSKSFAKDFMNKYGIPTASFLIFNDYEDALKYIEKKNEYPLVIKASGLAAGKGTFIINDFKEGEEVLRKIMLEKVFGESGNEVVIEEYLEGEECSYMMLWSDEGFIPFITSRDHKRAFEGDQGPNTGGMGAYAPDPFIDEELENIIKREIADRVFSAITKENIDFSGVLYMGLMVTKDGPRVLEFNVRFGDPEAQVVIPLMKSSFTDMLMAGVEKGFYKMEFKDMFALCTVLCSSGYPGAYKKGLEIRGNFEDRDNSFFVFAGVRREGNRLLTNGGRVLNIVGIDKTLQGAKERAYARIREVHFEGMFYRKDIGDRGIEFIKGKG